MNPTALRQTVLFAVIALLHGAVLWLVQRQLQGGENSSADVLSGSIAGNRVSPLPAISGPSALPPNFLQSGHASSSINGQPYSGAKGEPLREVAQI